MFWRGSHPDNPNAVRMTIGEHLDELRGCLVRSLAALLVACLLCIWPAKYLLELIARPVVLALRHHGQPDSFLATSPVEAILIYIKVVVVAGLIIASPYVITQIWSFVATGLYRRERDWVYRLVPVSIALFVVGVVFMYLFVLLLSLNFLVGFSAWLPLPDAHMLPWEKALMGEQTTSAPASQPDWALAPRVPVFQADPPAPPDGALWFSLEESQLKLQAGEELYTLAMQRGTTRALVTTHFRLSEYLSFVLIMTIAFGLAFQMPLVVVFLARSGIVPVEMFRSYRKVVILLIVILAAFLAPPDLLSHLLLSVPMILLFEIGLLIAGRKSRAPRPDSDT